MTRIVIFPAILCFICGCNNNDDKNTAVTESLKEKIKMQLNVQFDTSLNNADHQMKTEPGKLILSSTKETDFFIETGNLYEKANAPLLLKKVDNSRPFTFTIKFKPQHKVKYDAGMAFIYVDNKHWLKFAFEADERMNTRIVTVKTNDYSDDNNHDIVKDETIFLKISSDTRSVGFYYSTDHTTWNLVRVFKNDYPGNIFVGIGTQSPAGNGNHTIFEGIELIDSSVKDIRKGI